VVHLVSDAHLHGYFNLSDTDCTVGFFVQCLLLIDKLEVEMLVNKRNREPYSCFREGFADTDAFSAKERREGQSVAIFSSWCLGPLIVRVAEIKSSRYKLAWLHPLVRVMVDLCKVHDVGHAFLEEDFFCAIAYTNILAEGLMTRD